MHDARYRRGVGPRRCRDCGSGRRAPSEGETIVDVAEEADDFNTLAAALEEAGLDDALSGTRQLTVFAPTDEAYEALARTLGGDVEDLLNIDNLMYILLYLVTSGRRSANSVVNAPESRC